MSMSQKNQAQRALLLAFLLILMFVMPGCAVQGITALTSVGAAAAVQATATAVPATVSPVASELEAAQALEAQFIAVYDSVSPAVVNITSRSYVYGWSRQPIPQEGTGSGFVYDNNGHIITNYHVVEDAEELTVTLANGAAYEAQIVGVDPSNDLAVIRINAGNDLPAPLGLADSDQLRVGQFVLAIGNPFGLDQTLTTGIISALGRVIESPEDSGFIGEAIQTDAAINPGNSGGPLLDLQGRVIGVNSQIISTSGSSAGIGFAVSSNTVRRVVPQLISLGYFPHPWLGLDSVSLTSSTTAALRQAGADVPVDQGLLVINVTAGGPAAKAGIRGGSRTARLGRYRVPVDGDIITALDGEPVYDLEDLTLYVEGETSIGDTIELTIIRNGQELSIPVTLEEQPHEG
jgi:S1-C subfamily serine protease